MDLADPSGEPLDRDVVAMCYVVVTLSERGSAPGNLRVRFEFRPDLSEGRRETRTVFGADAACEVVRTWLDEISSQPGGR